MKRDDGATLKRSRIKYAMTNNVFPHEHSEMRDLNELDSNHENEIAHHVRDDNK
ncbi:MAG: hypothetical protein LAT57_09015 [Balneolales bacterium]|nr:hypothetical protein [Balneolales bacterium]